LLMRDSLDKLPMAGIDSRLSNSENTSKLVVDTTL
jgi:hypothetical protein